MSENQENIQITLSDIPTLYLGNETTVNGNRWDFGNSVVYLNTLPSEPNMLVNRAYIDRIIDEHDKQINSILDGSSISKENFKNFVDYVNVSQRENEAELISAMNTASSKVDAEVGRATGVENDLRSKIDAEVGRVEGDLRAKIDGEVDRATGVENDLRTKIDAEVDRANGVENDVRSKIEQEITRATGVENDVRGKIDAEVDRATGVENDLRAKIEQEITRANDAENGMKNDIHDITDMLHELKSKSSSSFDSSNLESNLKTESDRAMDAEKNLEEKIKALEDKINKLYQYFFHSNTITNIDVVN